MSDLFRDKRIMLFTSHPDDEVLGAGGAMAKSAERGCELSVLIPATGIHSRRNVQDDSSREADLAALREDTEKALACVGVKPERIALGDFADNEMDRDTLLTVVHFLERYIEEWKPQVLITHHWRCTNIDHRVCFEAATVALRPSLENRTALLSCEVPSSTGYLRPTMFEPSLYVGLEGRHVDAKIAAMESYRTEARPDPHPRSPEVVRSLAKVRGSESGYFWAEAFQAVRLFDD